MALTILDIANDLDAHVQYLPTGRTAAQTAYMVNAINAGLEDMRAFSPQSFRSTIELTWTKGVALTTTVSGVTLGPNVTFANYTAGCSLNISGDSTFNELAAVGDGSVASTAIFAYTGTPGSQGMTVWGDCVKLATSVDRVIGGALLHERRNLQILSSRAEFLAYQRLYGIYPYDYGFGNLSVQPSIIRQPGVPRGVWLEAVLNGNAIEYRARCSPLPNADYRATLNVQIMPAIITASDLSAGSVTVTGTLTPDATGVYAIAGLDADGLPFYTRAGTTLFTLGHTGGFTDTWYLRPAGSAGYWTGPNGNNPSGAYTPSNTTGTATITASGSVASTRPVPGHRDYNILRALCLYHWSMSPWFRNDQVRPLIAQGYQNAVDQLRGFRNNAAESPRSIVQY